MNTNPNAIIRALLDIAQAAYVLIHSPGRDMADNLRRNMALLEELPQYCDNPVNGPARASYYLQSLLVGGSTLGRDEEIESLMQRRARAFPPVIVNVTNLSDEKKSELLAHFNLHSGGVVPGKSTLVPVLSGDAIGFEVTQEWKGPAKLHIEREFVPSAEFPTSGPISHDFYSHRQAWRDLIQEAENATESEDHASYIEHELRAFDRAFASLPPDGERRAKPRLDLPTIPVVGKDALIEATRPLFEKAMVALGHRAELDSRGLYKGTTEYRFEGWRAAVETMGFKPGSDDIGSLREQAEAWQAVSAALHQHVPEWSKLSTRAMDSAVMTIGDLAKKRGATILHHMLADKTDEAHKIINDACLLANLHDLCNGAKVSIWKSLEPGVADRPWYLSVFYNAENYGIRSSTSFHQAIVEAHMAERDRTQPEPEVCQFCGFTVESPCEAPPPAECPVAMAAQVKDMDAGIAQANEMQDNMRQYGTIDKPALLTQVGWRHIMHQEHGQERVALTESKECPWGERGVGFDETYAVTAAPIYEKAGERPEPEGDASTFVPANPTEFEIRRNYMEKLLVDVKERFGAPTAKTLFGNYTPFAKMSLIPDADIETVIAAAEAKLKEPK